MKRLPIAIILLVVVAALALGSLWWQTRSLDRLSAQLDALQTAAETGDENVYEQAVAFEKACMQISDGLAFLSRHTDGYPIKESACQLPFLLQQEDLAHFYAEAARCQFYIEELRRAEIPSFGNIF